MRVNNSQVSQLRPESPKPNKPFDPQSIKTAAKSVPSTKVPIEQGELAGIANDLKQGLINKEEASNRFVAAVIDHTLKGKLGAQDQEKLKNAIQEFFANDEEFANKLAKNLKDFV